MKHSINEYIKQRLSSRSGHETVVFLIFLAIAALFWFLMSLTDEIQRDYELRVNISSLPPDITILSQDGELPTINVSVRDKGTNIFSKHLFHTPSLNINYSEFITLKNRLYLNNTELNLALRQVFGPTATIVSQSPDSISIPYTTLPPIKVPLILRTDISPKPQFTISGKLYSSVDSISLYSSRPNDINVSNVKTETICLTDINDTTTVNVAVIVPQNCRAVPSTVEVTIPVEPLITKSFSIPVETVNVPEDIRMVTFPSSVTFDCLIPMSQYNSNDIPIKAYADYNKHTDGMIPLELSLLPDYYKNVRMNPSNVEYLIEN